MRTTLLVAILGMQLEAQAPKPAAAPLPAVRPAAFVSKPPPPPPVVVDDKRRERQKQRDAQIDQLLKQKSKR